jgi:hypothetical protein
MAAVRNIRAEQVNSRNRIITPSPASRTNGSAGYTSASAANEAFDQSTENGARPSGSAAYAHARQLRQLVDKKLPTNAVTTGIRNSAGDDA